jgi:hypothetical protein
MRLRPAERVSALALLGALLSGCYYAPPTPTYAYVPCATVSAGVPPPPPAAEPPATPPPNAPPPSAATPPPAAAPASGYCVVQTGYAYPDYFPYGPYYAYPYPYYYPPVAVGVGARFHFR